MIPLAGPKNTVVASQVANGRWVEPSPGVAATFTTTDGGLITDIFNFPSGFQGLFTVFANGIDLGSFVPGDHLLFPGNGVSSFTITGISQPSSATYPFAVQLGFNEDYANLTITPASNSWLSAVNGNWSDPTKWTIGVPNADGAVAGVSAATGTAVTISLNAPATLGTLLLGSGSSGVGYSLVGSGSNTLTFSNTSNNAPAQISVIDGTHLINAPVVLASNLVVTSAASNPWTLTFGTASSIADNRAGYSLTMSGAEGTLILSGSNTYTGGTIVTAGTLLATTTASLPGYNAAGQINVAGGAVLAVQTGGGTLGWQCAPDRQPAGQYDLEQQCVGPRDRYDQRQFCLRQQYFPGADAGQAGCQHPFADRLKQLHRRDFSQRGYAATG